jgi:dCTP deaminase
MSVLSDVDIGEEIAYGDLEVEPVNLSEQLQPCSLDIRVGDEVAWYKSSNVIIDSRNTNAERHLESEPLFEDDSVLVEPDDFLLLNTEEWVSIPPYLEAELRGRSSYGRLGLEVHSTAGLVDPGFSGRLVMEVSNNSQHPIRLHRGDRIAQLVFKELKTRSETPYGEQEDSKYDGQRGAVGSRIWEEEH